MSSQEDCFHLGAKALIQNNEGKILILRQNPEKFKKPPLSYWDIPGGRMQKNESIETALKREVYEETGLELLTLHPFLTVLTGIRIPVGAGDVGLIFSTYLCTIPSNSTIQLSDEHVYFEWAGLSRAVELLKHYPPELLEKLTLLNEAKQNEALPINGEQL